MARVIFVAFDGTSRAVDAEPGQSVMQAAVSNRVPGIDGDCGGAMACGSCHVHLEPRWLARAGAPSDFELAMLETSSNIGAGSRLACQIVVCDELDGLVVHTPAKQNV